MYIEHVDLSIARWKTRQLNKLYTSVDDIHIS